MREKRGLRDKLKQILRSKIVISLLIFIAVSLISVIAGDITVKEGAMGVSKDLNVSGNLTSIGTGSFKDFRIGDSLNYWIFQKFTFGGIDYPAIIPNSTTSPTGLIKGNINLVSPAGFNHVYLYLFGTYASWIIDASDGTYGNSGDLYISDFDAGGSVYLDAKNVNTSGNFVTENKVSTGGLTTNIKNLDYNDSGYTFNCTTDYTLNIDTTDGDVIINLPPVSNNTGCLVNIHNKGHENYVDPEPYSGDSIENFWLTMEVVVDPNNYPFSSYSSDLLLQSDGINTWIVKYFYPPPVMLI